MKKVITYGTFDLFHIGHYNILKRAKECGDYLIVGVTGENYDAERGKLSVQDSLSKRIENVKKTGFADMIIVEEYLGQKISDILKYNVDILVVGSDWKGKFDHLNKYCEVKYLDRTKNISSTQIREEKLNIYNLGIVTDTIYDNDAVLESKSVSGIHVESVFAENADLANKFAEKYELDKGYSNYIEFLKNVDIVYIKVDKANREKFADIAIRNNKHVICSAPISLELNVRDKLIYLSNSNNVVFLDDISTLYLQSFDQLSWMTRGNVIGEILSMKLCISKENFSNLDQKDVIDLIYYSLCIVIKLLGNEVNKYNYKIIKDDRDTVVYGTIELMYSKTIVLIEIGMDVQLEDGVIITGDNGTIFVPDEWWNLGYFKMKEKNNSKFKRYSFNFDGNGFRYVIRELLHILNNKDTYSRRIASEDEKMILKILKDINN